MGEPNFNEFLKFIESFDDIVLTEYQKKLAESLIDYRVIHFSGGYRAGRTTVVNAVQSYFDSVTRDPIIKNAGKEI